MITDRSREPEAAFRAELARIEAQEAAPESYACTCGHDGLSGEWHADGCGTTVVILNESTRSGSETGAGIMRNRCAFTPRDMGVDWPEAFTYAVVLGWDDEDLEVSAMDEVAARWDWDPALVEFLRDAHRRFRELPDRAALSAVHDRDGQR